MKLGGIGSRSTVVTRALVARAYPAERPSAVRA